MVIIKANLGTIDLHCGVQNDLGILEIQVLLFCSSQTLHNTKQLLKAWLVWLCRERVREIG